MSADPKLQAWHAAEAVRGLADGGREFITMHCAHDVHTTDKRVWVAARCPFRTGPIWEEKRKHFGMPIEALAAKWWKVKGEVWYVGTEQPHAIGGRLHGASAGKLPPRERTIFDDLRDAIEDGVRDGVRDALRGARTPIRSDAHVVLGLDAGATADDIRRAYRKRALETHPDRGGDVAAFRRVTESYELLRRVVH